MNADHCAISDAAEALEVSIRRVFELAAQGVLGISVVQRRAVGVSMADVLLLSWPPVEGDAP